MQSPEPPAAGDRKEPLQVRIPVDIKRRFKALAAIRGQEPNELFVELWVYYQATHALAQLPRQDET